MLTTILAIFATLLFEAPFIGLEKIIFGRKPPTTTDKSISPTNAENGNVNASFQTEKE